MSNNKQSMKLYTREQMIEAFNYGKTLKGFDWVGDMIDSLTPIELPSDEEIKDASIKYYVNNSACFYFEIGAKWMRDKIKLGNK
jgi:hypothetical protein